MWRDAVESLDSLAGSVSTAATAALQSRAVAITAAVSMSSFARQSKAPGAARAASLPSAATVAMSSVADLGAASGRYVVTPAGAAGELVTALDALVSSLRDAGACLLALRAILLLSAAMVKRQEDVQQVELLVRQVLIKVRWVPSRLCQCAGRLRQCLASLILCRC